MFSDCSVRVKAHHEIHVSDSFQSDPTHKFHDDFLLIQFSDFEESGQTLAVWIHPDKANELADRLRQFAKV